VSAIELHGVSKVFTVARGRGLRRHLERVRAVDGVSFAVPAGQILGFIGPNGAGKSTTVKMLTSVLVPSAGTISVVGLDPTRQRRRLARRIGVVFGQRTQLWWDLPLADSFALLRHVYRVPPGVHARNRDAFISLLELGPCLQTPVRQLSLGQRMRGELTAALLHEPEILYLDEPTIGLDVLAKARIRELLLRLNSERGLTVLLTTHDMGDIERLCGRVLVIDHGHVIHDGDLPGLVARFGEGRTLVVDLEEPAPPLAVEGAQVLRVDGARQWLRLSTPNAAAVVAAVAARAPLRDLHIEEPDVEEVVRRIYSGA